VDTVTPHTNVTSSHGLLTLPGIGTNMPYTSYNPTNVYYGDLLPVAFQKENTNFAFLATVSDGSGNVGLNSLTTTNLLTSILATDNNDPPSNYGLNLIGEMGQLPLVQAHEYYGSHDFTCWDYYNQMGDTFFSWSFIDGGSSTRWGFFNVDEDHSFHTYWTGDNGYTLNFDVQGNLQAYSASIGYQDWAPSYTLEVFGNAEFDSGSIWTDGNGNLTCVSLNQTSDSTLKTNIAAVAPATMLKKLASVPVYSWRFLDHTVIKTNVTASTIWATNLVAFTNRAGILTNRLVRVAAGTNTTTTIKTNLLTGQKHIGPMAQDFAAAFPALAGGATNTIGVTDVQGVLIAAVQALAAQSGVFTNAAGAPFRLIVNPQTNGFLFVPQ